MIGQRRVATVARRWTRSLKSSTAWQRRLRNLHETELASLPTCAVQLASKRTRNGFSTFVLLAALFFASVSLTLLVRAAAQRMKAQELQRLNLQVDRLIEAGMLLANEAESNEPFQTNLPSTDRKEEWKVIIKGQAEGRRVIASIERGTKVLARRERTLNRALSQPNTASDPNNLNSPRSNPKGTQ